MGRLHQAEAEHARLRAMRNGMKVKRKSFCAI